MIRTAASVAWLILCLLICGAHAASLSTYGDGYLAVDACRANLKTDSVKMYWRDGAGEVLGHVDSLRDWLHARGETLQCASNAGIFGKDLSPIGLYVEANSVLHKLNTRKGAYGNFYLQPNGAFLLSGGQAMIVATDVLAANLASVLPSVSYATQSGPLLLTAGQINPLFTQGSDNRVVRNAVCVVSPQEIALVRSRAPINFFDFAQTLRDKVGCRDALYLDGSVSRLYPYDMDALDPSVGPLIAITSVQKR